MALTTCILMCGIFIAVESKYIFLIPLCFFIQGLYRNTFLNFQIFLEVCNGLITSLNYGRWKSFVRNWFSVIFWDLPYGLVYNQSHKNFPYAWKWCVLFQCLGPFLNITVRLSRLFIIIFYPHDLSTSDIDLLKSHHDSVFSSWFSQLTCWYYVYICWYYNINCIKSYFKF